MDRPVVKIQVQQADFDINAEIRQLSAGQNNIGAVVNFVGVCRDENGSLAALELEHYPGMVEAEIGRIAGEAIERWELCGLVVIHRIGKIIPGENIVLVIAASKHRQAAFEGANYLMDFLKTRAPFWKKEHLTDGSEGKWVSARESDDEALAKWQ